MARPRTRTKREDRDRRPKKKVSILDQESVEWIDYKDINLLRRFMSERAKIRARRVTGNDAQQQRAVARAIRIAREMALLPYSVRQVTHRSKGKRGDRDGGVLREFRDQPRSGDGDSESANDRGLQLPPAIPETGPEQPEMPTDAAVEAEVVAEVAAEEPAIEEDAS